MQVAKVSLPCWRTEMRYCPYCRRINEGKPQICNFCGRTWYIRLCQRGHENPYNAQYCGICGSADLTETAGPRPWFFIALKIGILIIIALSTYFIFTSLFRVQTLTFVVIACLFIFALQFALSMLPRSISDGIRKLVRWGMKIVAKAVGWFLMKVWEILK